MAPVAVDSIPAFSADPPIQAKRSGKALEEVEDAIDEVNKLKGQLQPEAETGHRYDDASTFDSDKDKTGFRNYSDALDRVKNFYATQHARQTVEFNLEARRKFGQGQGVRARMSVWEAIEKLSELQDDSDPDTELTQIEHLLQTAEAIRKDGKPEWMQVVGLVHDLGKLLYFYGAEGQWDVVGDTFVVGARPEGTVYPDTFDANPDMHHSVYSTKLGMYEEGCGLDNLMLSWGHDEYMYNICKQQSTLPKPGLDMIRFHSCYPVHREGAYKHFLKKDGSDEETIRAVLAFNPYDLYSKSDDQPKVEELKPYYQSLISKYFPDVVEW